MSLTEFGRLLAVHAGWGMRIAFVPEEFVTENPKVKVRKPERPEAVMAFKAQLLPLVEAGDSLIACPLWLRRHVRLCATRPVRRPAGTRPASVRLVGDAHCPRRPARQ